MGPSPHHARPQPDIHPGAGRTGAKGRRPPDVSRGAGSRAPPACFSRCSRTIFSAPLAAGARLQSGDARRRGWAPRGFGRRRPRSRGPRGGVRRRSLGVGGDLSESTHRPPSSSCSTRSPQALAAGERARENSCASTPPRPGAPRSRPRGGCARRAPAGEPRPLCPLAVTWSAMSSRPRPPGPPDKTGRSTLPPEVHAPPLELWTSPMGRRVARCEGAYMITSARTAPHRHMRPVVRPVPRPPSVENRNVW